MTSGITLPALWVGVAALDEHFEELEVLRRAVGFFEDIFYLGTNEEKVKLRKAMKDIQEIPPQSHSTRAEHGYGAGGRYRWYHSCRM